MKTIFTTLAAALLFSLTITSCDRDGNTGNGANDPTDQFESDKTKKNADFYGRTGNAGVDSTVQGTATESTGDTASREDRHQ